MFQRFLSLVSIRLALLLAISASSALVSPLSAEDISGSREDRVIQQLNTAWKLTLKKLTFPPDAPLSAEEKETFFGKLEKLASEASLVDPLDPLIAIEAIRAGETEYTEGVARLLVSDDYRNYLLAFDDHYDHNPVWLAWRFELEKTRQSRLQDEISSQPWFAFRDPILRGLKNASVRDIGTAIEATGQGKIKRVHDVAFPSQDIIGFPTVTRHLAWEVEGYASLSLGVKLTLLRLGNTLRSLMFTWYAWDNGPSEEAPGHFLYVETGMPEGPNGDFCLAGYRLWQSQEDRYQECQGFDPDGRLVETESFCYNPKGLLEKIVTRDHTPEGNGASLVSYVNRPSRLGHSLTLPPDPVPGSGYLFARPDEAVIAVWDSGVNLDHPKLSGKLVGVLPGSDWQWGFDLSPGLGGGDDNPYDFLYADVPPAPMTHGTSTLYASVADAPRLKALPLRAMNCDYGKAIARMTSFGARIANLSFGEYVGHRIVTREGEQFLAPLRPSEELLKQGETLASSPEILFVCAAGNAGQDTDLHPFYPASYPIEHLLAVGAATDKKKLASWSCYGILHCDVLAQGEEVLTISAEEEEYNGKGTSYAAPLASRLAGLVSLACPALPPVGIRELIMKTVDIDVTAPEPVRSGGVICEERALAAAKFMTAHEGTTVDDAIKAVVGEARFAELCAFWKERIHACLVKEFSLNQNIAGLSQEDLVSLARESAIRIPAGEFWKKSLASPRVPFYSPPPPEITLFQCRGPVIRTPW